jgi:hypothetical protein
LAQRRPNSRKCFSLSLARRNFPSKNFATR